MTLVQPQQDRPRRAPSVARHADPSSTGVPRDSAVVELEAAEAAPILDADLPLQRAYHWERQRASQTYLVQPYEGRVFERSWRETMDEARRVAAYLRGCSLPARSNIALLSKNCAEFFIFELAIWMAGHVSVAIYPTVSSKTLRYVLEHAECPLMFVGPLDGWAELRGAVSGAVRLLGCARSPRNADAPMDSWNDIVATHEPIADSPTRAAEDTSMLIYTSGSTGVPKAVEVSFAAIVAFAKNVGATIEMSADDRMFSYLPLAHTAERCVVELCSIYYGCRVSFVESLETFRDDLKRARPTFFLSVPRLWLKFRAAVEEKIPARRLRLLLALPLVGRLVRKKILGELGLGEVRYAGTGSAPMPAELMAWYRDLGLELLEGYGMSENFAYCTATRPGRVRLGTVGEPHVGVKLRISEQGEILMKCPALMKGYYKAPELTAQAFTEDGYLRTGDRGVIDDEGRLIITGRVKELFKTSKAKYVSPAPIENLLNVDDVVEQSCVMGSGMPQPFAVLMLTDAARRRLARPAERALLVRAAEKLRQRVNAKLEHHEQLAFVVVAADEWRIDNGMLTPTLKLKRQAIEDAYAERVEAWAARAEAGETVLV
ncbi:MAG: AMP-binding protein [Myxococcales bacterium]|nr:AMP-binding protein [Myxococcales bacterium]